jgi:hypothetical protein
MVYPIGKKPYITPKLFILGIGVGIGIGIEYFSFHYFSGKQKVIYRINIMRGEISPCLQPTADAGFSAVAI